MKTLKFTVRFFNYNKLHDQHEFVVQCTGYNGAFNQPSTSPFKIGVNDNFTKFGKISCYESTVSDVGSIVANLTDQTGRKNFENSFFEAISHGFENHETKGFDFEIKQNLEDASDFKFIASTSPCANYIKPVNGVPFKKLFSTDLGAVIAAAKLKYFDDFNFDEECFSEPTQLNVDVMFDEQIQKTLYYIELNTAGNWYDATTWLSGDDVKPFFSQSMQEYSEAVKQLKSDIDRLYEPEWETVYTSEGEFLSRQDYDNRDLQ